MTNFWRAYGDLMVLAATIVAPVALVGVVLWGRRLRREFEHALLLAVVDVAAAVLSALVLVVTWQPGAASSRAVDLVPFDDLGSSAGSMQFLGNLLLLAPLGYCVSRGFGDRRAWRCVVGVPLGVEAVQWLVLPGRVASVEDVLLGMVSMALGALAGTAIATWLRAPRVARSHDAWRG